MQPPKFCATGLAMMGCLLWDRGKIWRRAEGASPLNIVVGFLDSQLYQRAKERAKERMKRGQYPNVIGGRKRALQNSQSCHLQNCHNFHFETKENNFNANTATMAR